MTFEVFREGHVPDCERLEEITDPFNNAAGIDPEPEEEQDEELSHFCSRAMAKKTNKRVGTRAAGGRAGSRAHHC